MAQLKRTFKCISYLCLVDYFCAQALLLFIVGCQNTYFINFVPIFQKA
jgi:hypothetical protein